MEINPNQIYVWQIEYTQFAHLSPVFLGLLDEFEKKRLARFRMNDKAMAYTITHGFLRILIGKYLKVHPSEVAILQSENVKPHLHNPAQLDFNLSYTKNWSAIGIASDGVQIGIDIETVQVSVSLVTITQSQFSSAEQQSLAQLDESERLLAFYRVWTRKEAYLKAIGKGLSVPMQSFSVSVTSQPYLISQTQWHLHEFRTTPQIIGTVAANISTQPVCFNAGYELLKGL